MQLAHYERAAYGLSGLYDQTHTHGASYGANFLSIPQQVSLLTSCLARPSSACVSSKVAQLQDCGLSFHSALCEDELFSNHATLHCALDL